MFDKCIYFNLSTLTRKINKIWQKEFDRLGLSPSHGYLLFAIVEKPGISQKELAKLLELDASTITRFIEVLVHRGLVKKPAKGKGARFSVTEEGKKSYKKIKQTMDRLYHTMQEHFSADEFAAFVAELHTARQSFEERKT